MTSLREAEAGERWEGFWSVADERYYARSLDTAGVERWFRIADIETTQRIGRRAATRVLPFPMSTAAVPRMIVGRYRGVAMIVGARRRRMPSRGTR